jgi:hypothetical protein
MKGYRRVDVWIHIFLTSTLVATEWSVSHPCRLTPRERPQHPLDRRLGGPQSRSGRHGELEILDPTWTQKSDSLVQPVASRYTDSLSVCTSENNNVFKYPNFYNQCYPFPTSEGSHVMVVQLPNLLKLTSVSCAPPSKVVTSSK